MKPGNRLFKAVNIFEIRLTVIEKSRPGQDPNLHVYAIWCRTEIAGDGISRYYVKAVQGYVLANFEATISSGFQYLNKSHFVTVKSASAALALTEFASARK